MIAKAGAFVAKHAGKERSITIRILSLMLGVFGFFVVVPIALGTLGHIVARSAQLSVPRAVEIPLGAVGIVLGLVFLLWSVSAFWFVGKGIQCPLHRPRDL